MDNGEYVKRPIEITPTMNGGYLVSPRVLQYEMSPIGQAIAFSNYRDLLKWLNAEFPAANEGPGPSPDHMLPPRPYVHPNSQLSTKRT